MKSALSPARILLPEKGTERTWSVIACDQFTSDRAYWERVEAAVGDAPSALRLILPEAYLEERDADSAAEDCARRMDGYLAGGVLRDAGECFVYVEREVTGGRIRRGLVGKLDLEQYDWRPGTDAPVRATERTVPERLPPRIRVRRGASLDLPHVMLLMSDEEDRVFSRLTAERENFPFLYDFELMEGGGRIRGRKVTGAAAGAVMRELETQPGGMSLAVGDGNHSLAAAKAVWEEKKRTLPPEKISSHPARYALVEVVNVFDAGVVFEPIHRVVARTDTAALRTALLSAFPGREGTEVILTAGGTRTELRVPAASLGGVIGTLQAALEDFVSRHGGAIDYIHDEEAALALAGDEGTAAVLLPAFEKRELFRTVLRDGVFPKKSFSIGHARDKRYYLECRDLREV